MAQVARRIYAEGGPAAFFRGNGANVLKIAPETSVKFIAFDAFKAALARDHAALGNPTLAARHRRYERILASGGAHDGADTSESP